VNGTIKKSTLIGLIKMAMHTSKLNKTSFSKTNLKIGLTITRYKIHEKRKKE